MRKVTQEICFRLVAFLLLLIASIGTLVAPHTTFECIKDIFDSLDT